MIRCERVGCVEVLEQSGRGRPLRFCSDTCRAIAARERRHAARAILIADELEQLNAVQLVRVVARLSRSALLELDASLNAPRGMSRPAGTTKQEVPPWRG